LALSDAPFEGPTATMRIGRVHTDDGPRYVVNPTVTQLDYSDLDMVLAGHRDGINMIEVGAAEVDEEGVLGAIEFGQQQVALALELIDELVGRVSPIKNVGELALPDPEVIQTVRQLAERDLTAARQIKSKNERGERVE